MGKLALLYVPEISHGFKYFFLENDHFGNVVCQDWEFRKTDVGNQNFVEWYIWYNNKLFMWEIMGTWWNEW